MRSEFERLGVEVERVAAVDGSLPEVAAKSKTLLPGMNGVCLGPGAYACFQSHRLCWQKLVESGAPHAMILEDDVVFADGFGECLTDGWVPVDADIVRLETRLERVHLDRKKVPIGHGRYLGRMRSSQYGTACYVISNRAAERLHRHTETITDAVDEVMFDARHEVFSTYQVYHMVPAPAIPGGSLPNGTAQGAWSQSSIYASFAPGETADTVRTPFLTRLKRRFHHERRALLGGTRYTFIGHG